MTKKLPQGFKSPTFIYLASMIADRLKKDNAKKTFAYELSLSDYLSFWPEKFRPGIEKELQQSLKSFKAMSISLTAGEELSSSSVFDLFEYDKDDKTIVFSLNEVAHMFQNETRQAFESILPSATSSVYN